MKNVIAKVAEIRKALIAAASVLATVSVAVGVPSNVKELAATLLAALAAGGITYKVPNAPRV